MLDIVINPFITILLFLYQILGGQVVLAIVVFTILIRLATYPLTLKQQRSTKNMQKLQPELKKLQEKYKNDRERMAQAQMELYRQYGVNPLAGCLPLVIQLPIMLGLYRAIVATLAATPYQLLNLSGRLWVPELSHLVPLQNKFLWLNLAVPDPLYVLPILVVITTWLQQKIMMPSTSANDKSNSGKSDKATDQAAQMSRQMMMMMPIMFGFFALSFASGLSIYFIASNIIGMGQYALVGRGNAKLDEAEKNTELDIIEVESEEIIPKAEKKTPRSAPAMLSTGNRSWLPRSTKIKKTKRAGISDSRAQPRAKK